MSKPWPSPPPDGALDALPLPAFYAAAPGRISHANAACCQLLELSPAAAAGDGWLCRIVEAERAKLLAAWCRAAANWETFEYCCHLQLPQRTQPVLIRVQQGIGCLLADVVPAMPSAGEQAAGQPSHRCVNDSAGTLEYCSACPSFSGLPAAVLPGREQSGPQPDYSQQALQQRLASMEADLRLHAQILDSMLEGVCLVDAGEQCILYANPQLQTLYGYPPGSMGGLPLPALHADGGQTLPPQLQLALQQQMRWQGEWPARRLDGSMFWAQTSISLFRHPRYGEVWLVSQEDISASRQAQQQLALSTAELKAVARIQGEYIEHHNEQTTYETVLTQLLQLTGSEYGLVGEVLYDEDKQPFLRLHALTDISWDEASRAAVANLKHQGMEFRRLDTLLGHALKSGQPLLSNNPSTDSRAGGRPPGHPPLLNFMAVPVMHGEQMVGLVGVANRAGGYDEQLLELLQPLLVTYGQVISATRSRNEYRLASEALRQAEERWKFAIEGAGHGVWDWDIPARQIAGSILLARML
ncbi:PAS domain-containing protein, partial [Vogesella oryzae]|uniref:PAS domain-containing protein n=1 Tax=Vogesella oryzae TaxID=1735285 RepID=UPI001582FBF0